MRNLKRVLSLTLASVMLLGMMVVGSSAADYADVTSEHNTEAIEVLQAVGIMVGDNGNFNPDKNVTRNEMAVVMSNLMQYRVATYANTSPFTDVPAWAENYVAACYANGITSGMNATTYGGDKSVTTGQAALMLMKALGYFQYANDFGDDWLLATTRLGSSIDLFNGVEAGVREAMTRNDVAKLVLNTLKATMVEADDNAVNVTVPGAATITVGNTKYYYKVDNTSNSDYLAIYGRDHVATSINGLENQPTIELGEKLYEGNLKMMDDARDAYGRPAVRWTYKLDEIGYYPEKPIATYTAKVSVGELYQLVGKQVLDDLANHKDTKGSYQFTVYADGGVYSQNFDADRAKYFSDNRNASGAAGEGNKPNQAGKGVLTEVYLDNDGNLDIVYINTYVMKATDDFNAAKGTLSVEVLTEPANTVVKADEKKFASMGVTQLSEDDFDIANYKEDDYILYTVSNGKVQDIYPAEVIKGEVNAYSLGNSVTIDGTKYDYAKRIDGVKNEKLGADRDKATESAATEYRVGDVASVVVDQYGYVLYVDSAAISLGNYLYVSAAVKGSGLGSNTIAQAYFTDGTKSEITLDSVRNGDGSKHPIPSDLPVSADETGKNPSQLNGWYSYSVGSDGKYSLRAAKTNELNTKMTYTKQTTSSTDEAKLEGDKVNFFTSGSNSLLGNANTVLIVDDGDDVKVYTGVRNFPTIVAKYDSKLTTQKSITVSAFMEKDDENKTYVAAAFVKAEGLELEDGTQDNILYILNEDTHYVDTAKNETIYVYNAVVNGEATTIKFKEANTPKDYTFYVRYSVDGDGFYKVNDAGSNKGTYRTDDLKGVEVKVSGSSVKIGVSDYIVTDDTKIVVVLVPTSDKNNSDPTKADKVRSELLVDEDADYEVKTVKSGKNLNSMLGGYNVYGKVDGFTTETDSQVLETLYVTVYGIADKPAT